MGNKLLIKLVNWMLGDEADNLEYREIYLFGARQLFVNILNILTVLLIGMAFGELLRAIIFVTAFMIIRSYAGGYHASSPLRCYVLTTTVIAAALSAMKYIAFNNIIIGCIGIISSIIILILSPIDTANKRLDEIEYIYYRKKSVIIWCVEIIIALLCSPFLNALITESIIFAQLILSLSLIGGHIQNRFGKSELLYKERQEHCQ